MGYDRLWTIPKKTKITLKAFKFHKVHYRDLRASGAPPAQELTTILGVLGRLVARGVRIIVHNAKPTLRLLEQTAAQNGRKGWKFPFLCTDLATKSKRILNMPAKINPIVLATPSEREVYAYLYKKQYDDEDDDITSITDLATTCKIVVLNYLAGIGRECYRLRARARTSVVFARSFVRRHSAVESIGGCDGFDAVRDVPGRRARRRGDVRGMRGAAGLRFGFGRNDSRRR